MIHKRCDERIAHLEKLLDEEMTKNARLTEQVVALANKPPMSIIPPEPGQATVHYMDDARILELENKGRAPT